MSPSQQQINTTDMEIESTSDYSSAKSSPQSSEENLVKTSVRLNSIFKDVPIMCLEAKQDAEAIKILQFDGENCEFRPVVTAQESNPHKEWYHKLLMMKSEFDCKQRGTFPPFPPPPLPSTMIAASRAIYINSFDDIKRAAAKKTSSSPTTIALERSIHRFNPSDFCPLPPPHVFMKMIKTLAPHQYVDLTYALAGAVLLEIGIKIPDRYPPLPPKIEPFRNIDDLSNFETEVSSQSSSDGEYSDASETTRRIEWLQKRQTCERREARKVRIAAKKVMSMGCYQERMIEEIHETFPRESIYKSKTLASFIPQTARRCSLPITPPVVIMFNPWTVRTPSPILSLRSTVSPISEPSSPMLIHYSLPPPLHQLST